MASVQVGASCYANVVDAAAAVCAAHIPTAVISGQSVVTLSCKGFTDQGEVVMQTSAQQIGGTVPASTTTNTLMIVEQPCTNGQFMDAGIVIFMAILAAAVIPYGLLKIIRLLNSSRGEYNV